MVEFPLLLLGEDRRITHGGVVSTTSKTETSEVPRTGRTKQGAGRSMQAI
jgi:hypothetical protein